MKSAFHTLRVRSLVSFEIALLLIAISLITLHSSLFSATDITAPAPMSLRLVSLNNGQWMDSKKKDEVRREVDRIVAEGFNAISIGTYKFMPAYFIDYTKTPYPEAQQFDPKKSASQLETLRTNIR